MRLLPFALLLSLAATASAQGRMAFDATDHDLGRLTEQVPGRHTFRFTNTGDRPVTLVEVESSCGCTVPEYTPGAVAPGQTGTVAVRYETEGRPGPFEKAVRVVTTGAEPSAVTLRISGVVEPALVASGTRVGSLAFETLDKDLGPLAVGEPMQTSIQFANAGPRPVRVESVEASVPGVDVVSPRGPVFPDHLGGLFVTVEDPAALAAPGEPVEIRLTMTTTDPEQPVKTVVIRATTARASEG